MTQQQRRRAYVAWALLFTLGFAFGTLGFPWFINLPGVFVCGAALTIVLRRLGFDPMPWTKK